MASLNWCKKKRHGIKLIEPNDNLAREYIETAEESLEVLRSIKGKSRVWLAATKYYCEYFAVYSLLMRIGIKSEIHECTIAICRFLEQKKMIPEGYTDILENDKKLRIDNQYYKRKPSIKTSTFMWRMILQRGFRDDVLKEKPTLLSMGVYGARHLKNREVLIDYSKMTEFVLKLKEISSKITSDEISNLRKNIKKI